MAHGQECQYPVGLLNAKSPDDVLTKDECFAKWLVEQIRDAHSRARAIHGTNKL